MLRVALALCFALVATLLRAQDAELKFNRDIRPILSDHCFRCHGPDSAARKHNLRLDTPEGATALLESEKHAIVPGNLDASEMAQRISSDDPDEIMPPPALHHPLSKEQIATLRRWIAQSARYEPHWAFVAPHASAPPLTQNKTWPRDPLDNFILARLESENLAPAAEAAREALLRRAALTLIGLPPTPEETAAFVADRAAGAYETQIDRLLASPHFGEKLAADWLDLARFADTYGYQADRDCRVWPWRDWVINAFNANLPYDKFVEQQIAGDLLPNATPDTQLATAFNRLHRQTNEGGSIDAEFRQEYVSDRVHTFGTTFLGLTVECARCHDHKYDPVPQTDYYSLCSFFGQIDEAGTYPYAFNGTPRPTMRLPTAEQLAQLQQRRAATAIAAADERILRSVQAEQCRAWLASNPCIEMPPPIRHYPLAGDLDSPPSKATALDGDIGPKFEDNPTFRRCDPLSLSLWIKCPDAKSRAVVLHTCHFTIESDERGYQLILKDGRLCWEIINSWPGSAAAIRTAERFPLEKWIQVTVTYDGSSRAAGLHMYFDGRPVPTEIERDELDGPTPTRSLQIGFRDRDLGFKGGAVADLQVFDRELTTLEVTDLHEPGALAAAVGQATVPAVPVGQASLPAIPPDLIEFFARNIDPQCRATADHLGAARAAEQDLLESIPEIMVMQPTRYPRDFFILKRGAYDQPDPTRPVHSDHAIDALLPFDKTWPQDRLGLARWLTDPRHPLTARVEVNRLWSMCFGRGIVPTLENFGLQSEPPSHQELLDTLAADFVASGWNIKAMLRRIVLSATFRQDSAATPEKLAKDHDNILLSRGPSLRLSAEALRDQALFASGLLAPEIGGPSVKPWQPPGLWGDAGVNALGTNEYVPDTGPSAHRRSLYTFRKRTAPPPNMLAFDAGSREKCLARRQSTNTPLQPLVLLNDPVFIECARALALRATHEAGDNVDATITRAFRLLISRDPRPPEFAALRKLFDEQSVALSADQQSVEKIMQTKESDPHLAALTLVCSTLLASDAAVSSR